MQPTQTLSIQSESVHFPEISTSSSDGWSRTSAEPRGLIMNDGSHNKLIKSWSSLFQPSKPACTYWDQFSHNQKLDAIGPELSKPSVVGSGKAWSPKGDILEKWNGDILPWIQRIVDAELSRKFIYQGVKKRSLCTCDLWMVSDGVTCNTAHPTIVAICAERKIAKKTLYVLKRNPQLRDKKLGFNFLEWEENITLTAGEMDELTGNGLPETDALRLCGSRVVASSIPISFGSRWVQATIGGVLLLNGTYYGLSVAHPFYRDEDDQSNSSLGDNEACSLPEEDNLSDDESDWDRLFDDLSNAMASGRIQETSAYKPPTRQPIATTVFLARDLAKFQENASGSPPPARNNAQDFLENLSLVGHLPKPRLNLTDRPVRQSDPSDSQWVSFTLDWALVRLHDPRFWGRNWFKTMSGKSILTSFVAYTPPTGEVIIATRHNGPRKTLSSGRKCGLLQPRVGQMQEVWCLALSCTKGECGAWVIDPESGCLYGVVVASSQGLDVTYVLPAHRILADINEHFGSELGGPEDMFPKGEMEPWSWDMDEDIIGQRFQLYEDQQSIASTAPLTSAPASVFDQPQKRSFRLQAKNKSLITSTLYSDDVSSERPLRSPINPLQVPENVSQTTKAMEAGPFDGDSREEVKAQIPESKPQDSGTLSSQRETPASEQQAQLTAEVAAVWSPAEDPDRCGHNVPRFDPRRLHIASPDPATVPLDIAQATQQEKFVQTKPAEHAEQSTPITPIPSTQSVTKRPGETKEKHVTESSLSSPPKSLEKLPDTAVAERKTNALTRSPTKPAHKVKDSREYNAVTQSPIWQLHAGINMKYCVIMKDGQIGYQFEDGRRLTQGEFDQLSLVTSDFTVPASYPSIEQGSYPRYTSLPSRLEATLHAGIWDIRQSSEQTAGLVMEKSPISRMSQSSRNFLGIPMGSYARLYSFLVDHSEILSHTEIDSLISEARAQERIGDLVYSQTLVHHALLLRRCRELDPKDFAPFFKQLDNIHSNERRAFVESAKRVYEMIQAQERTEKPRQPQVPDIRNQGSNVSLSNQGSTRPDRQEVASEDRVILGQPTPNRKAQGNYGRSDYRAQNEPLKQPSRFTYDPNSQHGDTDTTERWSRAAELDTQTPMRAYKVQDARAVVSQDSDHATVGTDLPERKNSLVRHTSVTVLERRPKFYQDKTAKGLEIEDTAGDVEKLGPRYQKRSDADKFFTPGQVFSLPWCEPAGDIKTYMSKPVGAIRGRFGEEIFGHFLRFVVVKARHGACLCVPINTYGGRGVTKPGLSTAERQAHAIIYMSDTQPKILPEERDICKKPIAVDKASAQQKLDVMSRINFSRVHTVEWNVRVSDIGRVSRESMPRLMSYWRQSLE